jgi:hypothetical protein
MWWWLSGGSRPRVPARQRSLCADYGRGTRQPRGRGEQQHRSEGVYPARSVDPVYFENTHYLGADKSGEKPYRLLAEAMAKSGRVAIAELVSRGKEQLVLIRPYRKGLVRLASGFRANFFTNYP